MRITIRVRPGSSRPGVGGGHAGALVVRVSPRAVDGKATEAALAAVAAAFGVRRDAVTLVAGASGRTKVVDVAAADPILLTELLARPRSLERPGAVRSAVRLGHHVGRTRELVLMHAADLGLEPQRSRSARPGRARQCPWPMPRPANQAATRPLGH